MIDANQKEQAVVNQRHIDTHQSTETGTLQSMELVLPPGNFTIRVKILDIYDSCAELEIDSQLEVWLDALFMYNKLLLWNTVLSKTIHKFCLI